MPRLCIRGCGRQADRRRELCRSCYLVAGAAERRVDDWMAVHGGLDEEPVLDVDAFLTELEQLPTFVGERNGAACRRHTGREDHP